MSAFDYWRELQLASPERSDRLDPVAERARWQQMAASYSRNALHTNAPAFVEAITALVQPNAAGDILKLFEHRLGVGIVEAEATLAPRR